MQQLTTPYLLGFQIMARVLNPLLYYIILLDQMEEHNHLKYYNQDEIVINIDELSTKNLNLTLKIYWQKT